MRSLQILLGASMLLCAGSWQGHAAQTDTGAAPAKAPDAIDLYFDHGSSTIRSQDKALLDRASRLYDEGKPIVMIVAGSADATGSAAGNLRLSQSRADGVVQELIARGIPAERFQVLAKGVSDPPVPAGTGEERNRRVEITWR